MIYIVVLLVFLFVFAFMNLILITVFNKEKPIEKLKYFEEGYSAVENESNVKKKIKPFKVIADLIPSLIKNEERLKRQEIDLIRADIPISVEELMVIKFLSASALTFLFYSLTKSLLLLPVIFYMVWYLPKVIIGSKRKERIKLFDSQLNEGLMIISNSLKAGYSFLQAVAVVTEETKDPFSKEFKKLLKEMSLGISEDDALKNLVTRMESQDLKLITNTILIQKDIGGNLSEILDNISETIRERQKIKEELNTLMAQGKLSGIIVMLIPIFLGMIIYLFNREYMLLLFNTPAGLGMVAFALLNQVLGFFMIKKITKIEM